MSRSLVVTALLLFVLLCLLPIVAMGLRIGAGDLRDILDERTLALLGRTLRLGGESALWAFLLGLPFGFLVARIDRQQELGFEVHLFVRCFGGQFPIPCFVC